MESSTSSGSDATDAHFTNSLKLQILAYDSYQTKPSVVDKCYSTIAIPGNEEVIASSKPFVQVPVIRIFGKLTTGHTILVHMHNCFPYIFIAYDGELAKDKARENLKQLKLEIEKQFYISFKRIKLRKSKQDGQNEDDDIADIFNDYTKDAGDHSNYENKYVSSLDLVKSIPFYGYHIGYTAFVKISILNPRYLSRLTSMLSQGKIRNKIYQPFEAHIPYALQFMADYNLYGCDWIYLENFLWRSPIICTSLLGEFEEREFDFANEEIKLFNQMKINQALKDLLARNIKPFTEETMLGRVVSGLNVTSQDQFPRLGSTLVELDCLPQWVANRKTLSSRDLHHDFIELYRQVIPGASTKYLSSTAGILKDVQNQRKLRNLDTESFFSNLSLMTDTDVRHIDKDRDWVEGEELKEMLAHCIDLSNEEYKKQFSPDFRTFVQNSPLFDLIQTPRQCIENGIFRNIQWNKLLLSSEMDKDIERSSFFSSETSTPVDMMVLPSSMFESNEIDFLGEVEKTEGDNNDLEDSWMGTVPPHKSQPHEESLDDSELDHFEDAIFAKPGAIIGAKKSPKRNNSVSFSMDLNSPEKNVSNDRIIFSQMSKRRSSFILPPSSPVAQLVNSSTFPGGMLEFIGTTGLPKMDERFLDSFEEQGMLKREYPDPFYSKVDDVPAQPFIFAGSKFVLKSDHYSALPRVLVGDFCPSADLISEATASQHEGYYEFQKHLPTYKEVDKWYHQNSPTVSRSQLLKSQIVQTTPTSKYGFKFPSIQNKYERKKNKFNKMISLAVEIHVNTRGVLMPDPKLDEINAIFWTFDKENYAFDLDIAESGILILDPTSSDTEWDKKYANSTAVPIAVFDNEISMIKELVSITKLIDPDLLCGFEIHARSWGYIIERFRLFYDIDLCSKFSRVIFKGNDKFGDRWGYTHATGIKITGRHMMNLWRILRGDLNLLRYTLENVTFHVLHRRVPHYSPEQLTAWFKSGNPSNISAVLNYYSSRVKLNLELIERQEIISKTTEQARLIGVDFYSVFYRGSQFKVESFLVRLTKSENFMLISPSKQQVFKADALQCIPLVMEPTSAFYKSPLVVLDFQSLYPSVIIAYNYCYSTLLGRIRGYNAKYPQTIGITKNKLEPGLLELLKDDITISPNGLMFVKPNIRKSLLAKMLTEILETRLAVKDTMKDLKDDYELNKLYNSRQLALKLLANVTYGYTSATFSGRMPCADIADSIVATARETLNHTINAIESREEWGAKVIYGDTDSLFVYLPGKSREEAFRIGKEAAAYITSINPKPVKLKFEKVYHPSVLLSKKRYVGYSYTYEEQKEPNFDAKGIETVRRDGIPAQQKIVEKSLRILFETSDLSQVKAYVQDQFLKIITNRVSVQDFCFAKEVRIGTYKDERYAPAGAHLSKKLMEADERAEPQYKERVPYVVLQSYKGERLRDRCVTPQFFIDNEVSEGLRLDFEYYIKKALIPPLERIFNLMGVDVKAWYRDMPRTLNYGPNYEDLGTKKRRLNKTLDPFLTVYNCLVCLGRTSAGKKLCAECLKDELATVLKLTHKVSAAEKNFMDIMMVCRSCSSSGWKVPSAISDSTETAQSCTSDDCALFYSRLKARKKLDNVLLREAVTIEELSSW